MQTDGSTFPPGNEQTHKDEEITLEFPTELVPDEYKHENGSDGQLYVFSDNKGKAFAEKLADSLKVHKFDLSSENLFTINHVDDVLNAVDRIGMYYIFIIILC